MGTLYYGDNLDILTRYIADESVDLVYLDPPFNSAQNYNAFFQEKDGTAAAAQIQAFVDMWSWNIESRNAYDELSLRADKLGSVMRACVQMLDCHRVVQRERPSVLFPLVPRFQLVQKCSRKHEELIHGRPDPSDCKAIEYAHYGEQDTSHSPAWSLRFR